MLTLCWKLTAVAAMVPGHHWPSPPSLAGTRLETNTMTDQIVPHFHNDLGVPVIEIGAKEFMCVGALPPFDHPHVFCDMGDDDEYICPYCSTLYRHNPSLAAKEARPAECALSSEFV